MARVVYEQVTKRFGETVALEDFSLDIADEEFLVLVGPSGCGKSTALRLLAGLEAVTSGSIYIGETVVNEVAPRNRDVAMVFQSYALYPHLTVSDNIGFGLRLRKVPRAEIERRVHEAASAMGVDELLKRKPGQLSGGQRQRVAVARAIVREPSAFLLDEPLSNLDAKLRVHARAELSKLHRRLGATFIYVTHDQTEAMTMADRIAVMNLGVIQQVGPPQELYDRPVNMFVAGFIGSPEMNFFEGTVTRTDGGLCIDAGPLNVPIPPELQDEVGTYAGRRLDFGVRPESIHDVDYTPPGIAGAPTSVVVDVTELMGNEVFLHLLAGKTKLLARVDPRTKAQAGDHIEVIVDMDRVHFFDPETEEALR